MRIHQPLQDIKPTCKASHDPRCDSKIYLMYLMFVYCGTKRGEHNAMCPGVCFSFRSRHILLDCNLQITAGDVHHP